ncbi:MAG: phosphate propanoyltransferase [Firmicutes bacterium]|nr:phosphate propanoyltransferase [Bacillota bacterium]
MKKIPLGISGRHVHVTQAHLETLFGKGYELTEFKPLSQPGQYAANEKVDIVSPKGNVIKGVRILGPVRPASQVEISRSDALRGGFIAPVRSSGDVKGSGPCTLVGPEGSVELEEGVIIADRHIHFSLEDAKAFGVSNGDIVSILVEGEKPGLLGNVLCRVSKSYALDCHLDTDDGSAFMLNTGDLATLVKTYEIKS